MFKPSVDVGNIANIDIEEQIHEDDVKAAIESWICFDDIIDQIKFEPLEIAVNGSVWLEDPICEEHDITINVELSDKDLSELLVAHLDEMDRRMKNLANSLKEVRNYAYEGFESAAHKERWINRAIQDSHEVSVYTSYPEMMEMARETMNV